MSRSWSDASRAIQRSMDRSYTGPDRRSAVRVNIRRLKCKLGGVLDLSPGGVRLLRRRKLSGWHQITLFDRDGGVRIEAEVKWSKRHRLFKHEIGLAFLNVPPDIAVKLTTLASRNQT